MRPDAALIPPSPLPKNSPYLARCSSHGVFVSDLRAEFSHLFVMVLKHRVKRARVIGVIRSYMSVCNLSARGAFKIARPNRAHSHFPQSRGNKRPFEALRLDPSLRLRGPHITYVPQATLRKQNNNMMMALGPMPRPMPYIHPGQGPRSFH